MGLLPVPVPFNDVMTTLLLGDVNQLCVDLQKLLALEKSCIAFLIPFSHGRNEAMFCCDRPFGSWHLYMYFCKR